MLCRRNEWKNNRVFKQKARQIQMDNIDLTAWRNNLICQLMYLNWSYPAGIAYNGP